MFKTRLLSGILLVIVAFLTIHCGGWVLAGTLMLVSVIGVMELMRAMKAETDKQKKGFFRLTTAAGALTAAYYLVLGFSGRLLPGSFADISLLQMVCVIAMVVLLMCFYVFTYRKQ